METCGGRAYLTPMKAFLLIAGSLLALAGAILLGAYGWMAGGDTEIGGHGWAALTLGVVVSVVVGGGLMVLVFYSSRRGYDEGAHFRDDDAH